MKPNEPFLPVMNTITETQKIIKFLQTAVKKQGFKKVIIATSGGIDSTTVLFLAVRSVGLKNVYAILMPYGELSEESVRDASFACMVVKLPKNQILKIDIKNAVDQAAATAGAKLSDPAMETRVGNIMARMRMVLLFDAAKKLNALVIGTENKSEHLLGYFTRFGDEASDIELIRHLYKTQVFELAKSLGVPEKILTKSPTANLWEGQTDEGEFGFSYKVADEILYGIYDKKMKPKQLIKIGIKPSDISKVVKRVANNDFKHHLPIVYNKVN